MALNFPSTSGQATDGSFKHTEGGKQWSWDGTSWNLVTNASNYVHPDHTGDVASNADGATTIGNDKVEEKHINAGGTAGANKVLAYDSNESTNWKWVDQSGGTSDVVSTSADGLAPQLPNPHGGKFLKADGSWEVPSYSSGGGGSSTTTTGSLQSQMDATYEPNNGPSPGFTDLTTSTNYPNGMTQTMPTYSNDAGGSAVPTQPVSYAFDGRDDTFCDVSSTTAGGWVKLTFDNPVGLKNDGSDNYTGQIDKIVLGFDGQVQPGYNGANLATAGAFDGALREVTIYDSVNNPLSTGLTDLYFKTNTVGDKGRLYYVILSGTANSAIRPSPNRVTFSTTDISLTSAGSGHRPFIMHDSAGAIHLTPADVNAVVAVKTDLPRQIVLPMGSLMTPGDTITIMDVGTGPVDREDTNEYPDAAGVGHPVYNYNSGNASVNPILIYPDEEEGIQGTNIEPWSGDITNGAANNSGTGWFLSEPFHGMPFAINRNGGSIKLIYCGVNYGWRILP